jgi:hypothetical protein
MCIVLVSLNFLFDAFHKSPFFDLCVRPFMCVNQLQLCKAFDTVLQTLQLRSI